MTDTTVTVEHEDEEPEEPATESEETSTATTDSAVQSATAAAENKAHAQDAADDARHAGFKAESAQEAAENAADTASDAVSTVARIAEGILAAVDQIPQKVADAIGGLVTTNTPEEPVMDEEGEPVSPDPVTPPSKPHWTQRKMFGGKG